MLHISKSICQSKCQFLRRGRTCFPNVVAADGNRIEFWHVFGAISQHIRNDTHGWFRREDPFLLGNEFLQDIILEGAAELIQWHTLFFCYSNIKCKENNGRTVNGLGNRNLTQIDAVKKCFHVRERRNTDATFPYFSF